MYSGKFLRLLLVALSVTTVAQASWPENGEARVDIVMRQNDDTRTPNDDPTPTTPTTTPPGPTNPPDDTETSTSKSETSDSTSTSRTRTTPTPSKPGEEDPEPTDDDKPVTDEPVTETLTTVITTTNSDGLPTSFTSRSTVTRAPGLAKDGSGGSSGMTKETRNVVIGVVVGVGGAIVLGALGFVAWRIWGRKKQAEEQDNLMAYGGVADKSEAGNSPSGTMGTAGGGGAARNPFQQTLETYHAPTQVNASSNF